MTEDTLLLFDFPAVRRKKVTAGFDGGLISSDGGVVLLREAERRLGLAETLAGCIRDWRDPSLVVHTLPAMLRFRMFAIACGYEDADDCDALRTDPLFKLAVGRALVADKTIRMALARCQQVDGRIGLKIDLATQPTTDVEDIARRRTRSPVQQGRAQDPERRRQRPRRTSCIAPSPGPRLDGGAGGGPGRDRGRQHHRRRRRRRGGRRGYGGPGGRLTQGAELGARAARFREGGGSVQASPRSCAPGAPQRRREIWTRPAP